MGEQRKEGKGASRREALGGWLALLIWFLVLAGFARASTEELNKGLRKYVEDLKKLTQLYETPGILHQGSKGDIQDQIEIVFVKVKGASWRVWYNKVDGSPVNALIIGRPEGIRSMAFERWATNEER